jgi:hypothetical protein
VARTFVKDRGYGSARSRGGRCPGSRGGATTTGGGPVRWQAAHRWLSDTQKQLMPRADSNAGLSSLVWKGDADARDARMKGNDGPA